MPHTNILEIKNRSGYRRFLLWYKGFLYQGDYQKIIDFMENLVRRKSLYDDVDHILIYPGIDSNREKCFFLPIKSLKMQDIPPNIQENVINPLLKKRNLIKEPIKQAFSYNDVIAWVGSKLEVYEFMRHSIPYQPAAKIKEQRSPFAFNPQTSVYHIQNPADIEKKSIKCDRLLYWLSAMGSGSWESFKKACDTLQIEKPERILRRLRLLGHIESSVNGKRWSIAPTALVKVESDSENSEYSEYILCGQRSIKLLDYLKQYAQLTFIPQPEGAGPHCIRLKISDPKKPGFCLNSDLKLLTSARNPVFDRSDFIVANAGNASLQLAELLPDIKIWQEQLTNLPGIVPSLYQWQKFNCQTNNFEEWNHPTETGLYELRRENQNDRLTLFYHRERDAWLQGDWYGLRFLSWQHSGQKCLARYDGDTNRLAIPYHQRWPEIYERALVLGSGLLPTDQKSWLCYENAGVEQVVLLSDKLDVTC